MKRLRKLVKRKKNLRRIIAGAFVVIAIIEIGSHAFLDSRDPAALEAMMACRVRQYSSPIADCPENERQRQESQNLMDEMTTHTVMLSGLTIPVRWSVYKTEKMATPIVHALSRTLLPLIQPPENA